jgi:hypothetical protein
MTFLECVNRIFVSNGKIKGDDDAITTFSDTAHSAAIEIAKVAVQDELNSLVSDRMIDYELGEGTIVTVAGTRTYALPADFVRFWSPHIYGSVANRMLYEFRGGRDALAATIGTYKTDSGDPYAWYWEPGTSKKIGFVQVPAAATTYVFDYEKSVAVSASSDTLPFHNEQEAQAFSQCAGRRFKGLFEDNPSIVGFLNGDPTYVTARATLAHLMKPRHPYTRYGAVYR